MMHPKIKELLQQAKLYCYNDGTVRNYGEDAAGQVEEFARVIVQECMNIAAEEGKSYKDGTLGREASDRIWFQMKNKFGV